MLQDYYYGHDHDNHVHVDAARSLGTNEHQLTSWQHHYLDKLFVV
jgi:hypothetical protein